MRLFVAVLVSLLVSSHGDKKTALQNKGDVNQGEWRIAYSPGMPGHMSEDDVGYYFDFPKMSEGSIHYVYKSADDISAGDTVTMKFEIKGNGNVIATEGFVPAAVRLFIQQENDRLTASEPYKRWWSTSSVKIRNGSFTLTAKLEPSKWSSVNGKNGNENDETGDGFKDCVDGIENIGFTFGGQLYGHGVALEDGKAKFRLSRFDVE